MTRLGFLGPLGTFHEQAALTQADLREMELVALASIPAVLTAVEVGEVDVGLVAVENSLEGAVTATLDTLTFGSELLIQREIVMSVQLNLLVVPGTSPDEVKRVVSFPVATGQCRRFLAEHLPDVETVSADSTAEAARVVGRDRAPETAAIGTALAADLYDLEVAATAIEDHPENETRFVVVAREGVPAPTGHDKTSIVCFQQADRPGSLLAILQEFAARAINLTKLESRPTKTRMGDYCFVIDLEGHVADEVVGDCLRDLRAKIADVRFLGSYPAAGEHGESVRRDADASWRAADGWLQEIRGQIRT